MIEPQPGERRGINTINEEGPGLQNKEEPGAALPDRDPNFKCAEEKNQVRTRTSIEVLERDCALDSKVWLAKGSPRYGAFVAGGEGERCWFLRPYSATS